VELDFSHLGAWHTASVKRSMGTLETFFGSVRTGNPKKSSYVLGGPATYEERYAMPKGPVARVWPTGVSEEPFRSAL
jgi:hypothetical protein